MEINWGTTLVGLIVIIICSVPFVIMQYKSSKKESDMLKLLNDIAKQHNCKISQHEFCGDFVFGLDEIRNCIFFYKQNEEKAISKYVDLFQVRNCLVLKKTKTDKNNIGNLSIVERIELSFLPTNKDQLEVRFELFDKETNMQLSGELQFVEKWTKLINERLKNR
jgi:hypothetical protein